MVYFTAKLSNVQTGNVRKKNFVSEQDANAWADGILQRGSRNHRRSNYRIEVIRVHVEPAPVPAPATATVKVAA